MRTGICWCDGEKGQRGCVQRMNVHTRYEHLDISETCITVKIFPAQTVI